MAYKTEEKEPVSKFLNGGWQQYSGFHHPKPKSQEMPGLRDLQSGCGFSLSLPEVIGG